MKTKSLSKRGARLAVVSASGLALLASAAVSPPVRPTASFDQPLKISVPRLVEPSHTARLPFQYRDFIHYFADALGVSPTQIGDAAVFSSQGDQRELDAFQVLVSAEARDLFVSVAGRGDYALSLTREFFEAPFFWREETLGFYAALDSGRASQTLRHRRFTLRMDVVQHENDFHVIMQFSPPRL
jgi:hypothetical protein